MNSVLKWITRIAEFMAAMMMAAMFATFILQIAIRYSAKLPWIGETFPLLDPGHYGWTLEFCLALWIWIVFFGNAFIVHAGDHVKFDVLYHVAPPAVKRVFLVITGLAISIGLLWSLEPTWSKFYVLRLKKTATLSGLFGDWLRMRDIYIVYIVFLVVAGVRFGAMGLQALFYGAPDDDAPEDAEAAGK